MAHWTGASKPSRTSRSWKPRCPWSGGTIWLATVFSWWLFEFVFSSLPSKKILSFRWAIPFWPVRSSCLFHRNYLRFFDVCFLFCLVSISSMFNMCSCSKKIWAPEAAAQVLRALHGSLHRHHLRACEHGQWHLGFAPWAATDLWELVAVLRQDRYW